MSSDDMAASLAVVKAISVLRGKMRAANLENAVDRELHNASIALQIVLSAVEAAEKKADEAA